MTLGHLRNFRHYKMAGAASPESTSTYPTPPFFASSCVSCPILLSDAILWTQAFLPGRNADHSWEASCSAVSSIPPPRQHLLTSLFSSSNSLPLNSVYFSHSFPSAHKLTCLVLSVCSFLFLLSAPTSQSLLLLLLIFGCPLPHVP